MAVMQLPDQVEQQAIELLGRGRGVEPLLIPVVKLVPVDGFDLEGRACFVNRLAKEVKVLPPLLW